MADLHKRVYSMLGQNNNLKNNDIVKHFVQEGFKRRTIYHIIKRYEIGLPAEDLPNSGRPTSFKGKSLKRLQNAATNRIGVSQRSLGKKFGVTQSNIHYNLNKLVLVWLGLSAKGISIPYIDGTKGLAITADIYINKCLSKRRSFIEEHHAGDEYIFWPNLASSHYAHKNSTMASSAKHQIRTKRTPLHSQTFQSRIRLTAFGTAFQPRNPIEILSSSSKIQSLFRCAMQCNQNRQCRTFDYDYLSLICRLFEGELSTGSILYNDTLSSRIGAIFYDATIQSYSSYGQPCQQCGMGVNRYLQCINNTCQCPPNTFWDGQICLNQLYNGSNCNYSLPSCRQDLNLYCSNQTSKCTVLEIGVISTVAMTSVQSSSLMTTDTASSQSQTSTHTATSQSQTSTHTATSQSKTSITTVTSSPVTSIFWAFDNNVNDLYNVYNGVPTSVTYYSPGINGYGTAAQFSYSISSINIPSPYINLQNRSYTFDCWVNPGTTIYSNDYLIFFVCPVQQNDKCMQVLIRYGKPMLTIWYGDCLSSNNITVSVWTHLAFVFDYHASQATLYVNGVVDTVCTSYPSFQGTPNIASWIGCASAVSMYYAGLIDQLSLVTRVKTGLEILDAATLVLYYSFDNNVSADSGPNLINGTGINVAFASGRINQAVMLNTTPAYVTASNLVLFSLLNQPYSFSFWINAYSTINATLVHAWKSTLNNNSCLPILGFTSLGSIVAQKRNSTTIVSIGGPVISPHTWVHIAHTYSPSDGIRLFINGTLVASSYWPKSIASNASTVNIAIGHCINVTLCSCSSGVIIPGQYNGLIDEFRFYSRRLNTSDILALANP
ncbi:unnamed protein product [Rotaria magnacalcarata]|uniref:Apple domain-containing protein n=1 Tax=Rotaria magnacalcarata TaxID=392030 RepID=A0A816TU32_9BILA|nr:unnamed protein product [Rotaria magnacalcarata]CAF4053826.1 unnamed protein product [Rotaria magnacalcarata]